MSWGINYKAKLIKVWARGRPMSNLKGENTRVAKFPVLGINIGKWRLSNYYRRVRTRSVSSKMHVRIG